jgi:hypothetical protein
VKCMEVKCMRPFNSSSMICSPTRADNFFVQLSRPPHSWGTERLPQRHYLLSQPQPPPPMRTHSWRRRIPKYKTGFQDPSYSSDPPLALVLLHHTFSNSLGIAPVVTLPWSDHLFPASITNPTPMKRVPRLTSYDRPILAYASA